MTINNMMIPANVLNDTVNYFRTVTTFPAYLDGPIKQTLQLKIDQGATWSEATEEVENAIRDGVIL